MAITDDHGIYYPEVGADLTPLNAAFGTLAQSTDDAITEALDTIRSEVAGMFAPSTALGGRAADFPISTTTSGTVIPLTHISTVRGNPAPVLSNNGIMVRIPGTYFLNVRGQFDGTSPGYWRNINITLNGERIATYSSTASGAASRMFEGSEMWELDANDIIGLSTHASENSTGMRAHSGTKLSITRVGPKGT